jgi:hypothetical protein
MIADIIHDFDSHLDSGHVWLVELELEWSDENSEPSTGWYNVDTYVIAPNRDLAQYITTTLYPDALSYIINDQPITREGYVTRRDRSRV